MELSVKVNSFVHDRLGNPIKVKDPAKPAEEKNGTVGNLLAQTLDFRIESDDKEGPQNKALRWNLLRSLSQAEAGSGEWRITEEERTFLLERLAKFPTTATVFGVVLDALAAA